MTVERYSINIEGVVQGVGFRPFVYHLAHEKALDGWVANNQRGVHIEVQGEVFSIREFLHDLKTKKPERAEIYTLHTTSSTALKETSGFAIKDSVNGENPSAIVPPDMAPCDECQKEIFDPLNRRYLYPFSNCTCCGPRFTVVERLPYDRANTTMKQFPLCDNCQQEYENPHNRRFHAEPTACPDCGPQLQLCEPNGQLIASKNEALKHAAQAINDGLIIAVKAVGGFQLLVDGANAMAVAHLRARKQRPAKPFALMYPDIELVQQHCLVCPLERELLLSAQRPIVLLSKKDGRSTDGTTGITSGVAPGNADLGIMLPSSPLHHLLMSLLQRPIVATSGNIAGEPICIMDEEAFARLGHIADLFLIHDRPIVRPVDDSVVRVINGQSMMLRRSRGYAPLPLLLYDRADKTSPRPDLLAVGGHMKNTVAISRNHRVYLSQHLGDLSNRASRDTFERAISDLTDFYTIKPTAVIHDQHPGYASTVWARSSNKKCMTVQHHVAHFFSCMAEHHYIGPALGVSWDGAGYGPNGIIHGGECLYWDGKTHITSVATLRPFPLPGGEQAIREPRRQAAGLLYALLGEEAFASAPALWKHFNSSEKYTLSRMLARQLNSPLCSSVGRLFDGVASLLGIATHNDFEGQAAMALEASARHSKTTRHFPFALSLQKNQQEYSQHGLQNRQQNSQWLLDWGPMVMALIDSDKMAMPLADMAAAFHNTLAQMIVAVTQQIGNCPVFLSGGVFQNRRLMETVLELLRQNHRQVYRHQGVPPNDGGISLGQIYFAHCMGSNAPCV